MTQTFAGLPISGSINKTRSNGRPQKTQEEFAQLVTDLLNAPGVEAIKFQAYTPYFNDGDACEFGVRGEENYVRLEGFEEDYGDYEDGFTSKYDVAVTGGPERKGRYDSETRRWVSEPTGRVFPRHPAADQIEAFSEIFTGSFDDVIYELFGDHAEVTITSEGIAVVEYNHE